MPAVELLESPAGPFARVEGEGPLVDLCDDVRGPVELSCRGASCGTCRVEVLAGAELLAPPGPDEASLLARIAPAGGAPSRLACQAVVRSGTGLVRLRWVGRRA